MAVEQQTVRIRTTGKGPVALTKEIARIVAASGLETGLVNVFCQHTSCSMVLMENADPTAWADLEAWMERLVPEGERYFRHTIEGPDDMPSHIKMALTRSSETIPVSGGMLQLGTWQGIYLWEHRARPHVRTVVVTVMG